MVSKANEGRLAGVGTVSGKGRESKLIHASKHYRKVSKGRYYPEKEHIISKHFPNKCFFAMTTSLFIPINRFLQKVI
jgi:hypothetical protein